MTKSRVCVSTFCVLAMFLGNAWAAPYDNPDGNTRVVCLHDSTQTYELYIPPTAPETDRVVLYGFDPGGNGKSILRTLAPSALANGWIVAASNNSHNGPWSTIFTAQDAIIQDTEARWNPHPTRRFAAGFSGGARASLALAFRFPAKVCGVLCMGAGWPVDTELEPSTDSLIVRMICGTEDSNYGYDIPQTWGKLIDAGVWCELDSIEGLGHALPPAATILSAALWLNANAQTDRNAGYVPEVCAEDAAMCQGPNGPEDSWSAYVSDVFSWVSFDDFQDVESPISRVEWWGYPAMWNCYWLPGEPCEFFTISFHVDVAGFPGPALYEGTVVAEVDPRPGYYRNNFQLLHHSAALSEPVEMTSGWICIRGVGDFFLWVNSPDGNGRALQTTEVDGVYDELNHDLAVSLGQQPIDVEFDLDRAWGELPHTVTFCAWILDDYGEELTWLWDFGDGHTSSDPGCVTHTYETAGTYSVTLTVTTPTRSGSMTRPGIIVAAEHLPAAGLLGLAGLAALLAAAGAGLVARKRRRAS